MLVQWCFVRYCKLYCFTTCGERGNKYCMRCSAVVIMPLEAARWYTFLLRYNLVNVEVALLLPKIAFALLCVMHLCAPVITTWNILLYEHIVTVLGLLQGKCLHSCNHLRAVHRNLHEVHTHTHTYVHTYLHKFLSQPLR